MNKNPRDRWLTAIIPVILTAGIYLWMYGRPASRALDDNRARLVEMDKSVPKMSELRSRQQLADDLSDKVADEKERAKRIAASLSPGVDSRAKALNNLSSMLTAKGLTLIKSAPNDGGSTKGATAEVEALCKNQHMVPPQFWHVELSGTYQEMQETLLMLSQSPEFVIPISIEMNANEKDSGLSEEPEKRWSLTLWI